MWPRPMRIRACGRAWPHGSAVIRFVMRPRSGIACLVVTCALATIGLDRCRARLVADPSLDHAVAEVEAFGTDGSYLQTIKRQPAIGVTGTEMFASTLRSVQKATANLNTLDFV